MTARGKFFGSNSLFGIRCKYHTDAIFRKLQRIKDGSLHISAIKVRKGTKPVRSCAPFATHRECRLELTDRPGNG